MTFGLVRALLPGTHSRPSQFWTEPGRGPTYGPSLPGTEALPRFKTVARSRRPVTAGPLRPLGRWGSFERGSLVGYALDACLQAESYIGSCGSVRRSRPARIPSPSSGPAGPAHGRDLTAPHHVEVALLSSSAAPLRRPAATTRRPASALCPPPGHQAPAGGPSPPSPRRTRCASVLAD